jgi:hypothetical protein
MSIWIFFYLKLEHGVTLVDAPLLLDEGFGLEEVSLIYYIVCFIDLIFI